MLVLASAAVICAAVPLSVTELLPLAPPTMVTPVVVSTLILPCDTVSTVCSRSAVFGPSDTEIPLSEIAVFSLTAQREEAPSPTPSSYRRPGSPPSSLPKWRC